jgi:hypothetical protein
MEQLQSATSRRGQELMLEQHRFSGDSADSAWAQEFREGDEQVNRQEEQIAHESNTITPVIARKTGMSRTLSRR